MDYREASPVACKVSQAILTAVSAKPNQSLDRFPRISSGCTIFRRLGRRGPHRAVIPFWILRVLTRRWVRVHV
jgi:hypothetical protein